MLFNKKVDIDLIDFSITHIGTGQIGRYILEFLYGELGFKHIGYKMDRIDVSYIPLKIIKK